MQKGENREVKKIVLLVFTSILFLSCVGFEFQLIKCVGATDTWTVDDDGPAEFSRIQDAVDASTPGDVINFKVGKYYEHIGIRKPLILIGEDTNNTVISINGFKAFCGFIEARAIPIASKE